MNELDNMICYWVRIMLKIDMIYFFMEFNACQFVCVNHQYFCCSIQCHSLLFHIIEVTMSDTDQSNDEESKRFEEVALVGIETRRFRAIIENQVCRAKCGCIVQICKTALLNPELCKIMREEWIYGIISNEEIFAHTQTQFYIR